MRAPTTCAWCIEEEGDAPGEETSHGICQDHADQFLLDYYWQKGNQAWKALQATPSYVERFAREK